MRLKILFLSHKFHPDLGGIEVNSEILAMAFHRAGHEVRVLTWTKEKGFKNFPYNVIRHPNAIDLLREHRWANVVFENNPCLRLSWPRLFFKSRSVIALCTWLGEKERNKWQDRLKLFCLHRASAVIAVSEAVKNKCWPGAIVIGNPYNAEVFTVQENIERNKTFVFLGRLVSDKGVSKAIEAFLLLSKKVNSPLSLTIVGDGPERQNLESLVKNYELERNVSFTGALSGDMLVRKLNEHRFMLVPSEWEEPFGNVALEGMACGCLPIVSDGGGLPDAVGDAGVTFRRGDVNDLVKRIQILLSNPDKEKQLRNNAKFHLAVHNPSEISKRYLAIIQTPQ